MRNNPEEKLNKLLEESDKVVATMLARPYEDVEKFREACVTQMFRVLVKKELVTSELCVAMSYFVLCTEENLLRHPDRQGKVSEVIKGMSMDKEALEELKSLLGDALANDEDKFVFRGQEVDVGYAKYLIEYLEGLDDNIIEFPDR